MLHRASVDSMVFRVIWDFQECMDLKVLLEQWAQRSVHTHRINV